MAPPRIVVLGAGASGIAASELALAEGAAVVLADERRQPEGLPQGLLAHPRFVYAGPDASLPSGAFDLAVTSPGLPPEHAWFRQLEKRGVPVTGELAFAARYWDRPWIAVTGSNGKSSVCRLAADALIQLGLQAEPCGNYGRPFADVVLRSRRTDWAVVEVSSFQLETCPDLSPDGALLLNLLPNHLDRHGSMDRYSAIKARLFEALPEGAPAVVPCELAGSVQKQTSSSPRWITFGERQDADWYFSRGQILSKSLEAPMCLEGSGWDNTVRGPQAAAVAGLFDALDLDPQAVSKAAKAFRGLPHRVENLGASKGIQFINDSKATNLAAMAAGLGMATPPIRLIAGGRPKEKDYDFVKELLAQTTSGVYLIGDAALDMKDAWSGVTPCRVCTSLGEAFQQAVSEAESGETLLLSPGCASFDQFKDFEDRGDQFRKLVLQFMEEE